MTQWPLLATTSEHPSTISGEIRLSGVFGINFIDTADVYSAGGSEEIVGKAIAGRRDNIVAIAAPVGVLAHRPMHRKYSEILWPSASTLSGTEW